MIEGSGFRPGNEGFIFSTDDLSHTKGRMPWGDIYTTDLEGRSLKRLTFTPFKHDENAEYSPDGKKIVYSTALGGLPGEEIDLFMMDSDGSNKVRLTYFSEPGSPEYLPEKHRCEEVDWGKDGKKIIFALGIGEDLSQETNILYLLTFEGSCGKQ